MKVGDKFKAYSDNTWVRIEPEFIGKIGIIELIDNKGDIKVRFKDPYTDYWWFPGNDPRSKKYTPFKNKLK